MPDKDIDKIPITVEVPKADVWVRNDYRDIVRRLGEVHMIRACEHQHDDDFVPLYDIETLARYQIELERLRADAERYRWLRDQPLNGSEETAPYISAAENDNKHWALTGAIADEVIDAAMKEKGK